MYVDDITFTSDYEEELWKPKTFLTMEFEIKDLGNNKLFLGMEVAKSKKCIFISQLKYILDLLKKTGMLRCQPAGTPTDPMKRIGNEKGTTPIYRGDIKD